MSTKNGRALAFYEIVSIEEELYRCKLCVNKKKPLSGKKKSNLVAHLRNEHKEVHDEHVLGQKNSANAEELQLKLLQCMVEKVTINGRPFASLNDSGYIKSIDDKLDICAKNGFDINLRDKKYIQVKKCISDTANKITEKIKAEASGRSVSLMLDTATKNHKSILGINLRYIIDGKIIERCIGMIPLEERHTSRNLAIEVKKCIEKFGIKIKQVKSITTDNAGNVVAVVDYLDEELLCAIEEEEKAEELPTNFGSTEQSIANPITEDEIHEAARSILEEEAMERYLDDSVAYDELLKQVIDKLPHHLNGSAVNVRCGAHTINLIVRGALKKSNFHELVAVCTKVAKSLRQESYVREARKLDCSFSLPPLNINTRWDSDYIMVIFSLCLFFNYLFLIVSSYLFISVLATKYFSVQSNN